VDASPHDAASPGRLAGPLVAAFSLLPPAGALWWWQGTASGPRQELLAAVLYWLMPLYLLVAAVAVWRWGRAHGTAARAALRRCGVAAAFAAALAAAVLALVEPRHRMQWDETSLLGTAQSMHRQRRALLTGGAVPFAGGVVPVEQTLDKRPPLFPFVVSALHGLLGERPANAFAANGLVLWLALCCAAVAAFGLGGAIAAATAPLLLLAAPLTALVATSGGFELLAATLLLLVLAQALAFVRAPDDRRAALLLASGLLFAAVRYEGLPVLGLVLALAAWQARGRWRPGRSTLLLLAALPTLLAPLGLLLLHGAQERFYPEANGRPLLSVAHFAAHVGPFAHSLFAGLHGLGWTWLLSGAAALAWGMRLLGRQAGARELLVVVPVAAATALALAWFYGDVREATALRLFVPAWWFVALSPLLLLARALRRVQVAGLVAAAALAGLRLDGVRNAGSAFDHPVARLTDAIDRALPKLGVERSTLLVSSIAQHLIAHGQAALTPAAFLARAPEVAQLRRGGHLRAILVLETPLDAGTGREFGEIQAVLRAFPSERVQASAPGSPLVVHRLRL
jgi:hypothetical protein